MAEVWPNPNLIWDYPEESPENTKLWQAAIDESLGGGAPKLKILSTGYKSFDLTGECPRCGHETEHGFEVEVYVGVDDEPREVVATTNVDCVCSSKHTNAPEKRPGCGWGGPLQTVLRVTMGGS